MSEILEVNRLNKSYRSLRVLRDVALSVSAGELLAVVGANGSGKSTLLECLVGAKRATSGEIIINGLKQGEAKNRKAIAELIGFSLQDSLLYGELSVSENLQIAGGFLKASSSAEELISQFGLSSWRDRVIDECSSGVRKKTSLARAFLHQTKLLILDEPFAFLDKGSQESLKQRLKDYTDNGGAVVFSTHSGELVEGLATESFSL